MTYTATFVRTRIARLLDVLSARVCSGRYQDDGGAAGGGAAGGAAQPQWSSQPAGNPAGGGDSGVGGYRSTNAAPVAGADGSAAGGNEDYANEPPLLEGARTATFVQLPTAACISGLIVPRRRRTWD